MALLRRFKGTSKALFVYFTCCFTDFTAVLARACEAPRVTCRSHAIKALFRRYLAALLAALLFFTTVLARTCMPYRVTATACRHSCAAALLNLLLYCFTRRLTAYCFTAAFTAVVSAHLRGLSARHLSLSRVKHSCSRSLDLLLYCFTCCFTAVSAHLRGLSRDIYRMSAQLLEFARLKRRST